MFFIALLIGIFAYTILFLGRIGKIQPPFIEIAVGILFFALAYGAYKKFKRTSLILAIRNLKKMSIFELVGIVILIVLAIVNLVGALSPEIFYDALWYHLTLPKLYLQTGRIYFIKGNLFYYSAMPQLLEMLYLAALSLTNEIGAKLIHYFFGLLIVLTIIKFGRKYLGGRAALLAALIFYSDLTVAWLSTTAYIDLGRTFFECLAFFCFLDWWIKRLNLDLVKAGIMIGLAISTKYFALGSFLIISLLIFVSAKSNRLKTLGLFILPAAVFSIYWFIFAYQTTGNPIYPIFSKQLNESFNFRLRGPLDFLLDFFRLSNMPIDWIAPMNPLYLVLLPLLVLGVIKKPVVKIMVSYCFLAYCFWFLIPKVRESRFFLPYLPGLALLAASFLSLKILPKFTIIKKFVLFFVFIIVLFNLTVRLYINKKYLSVILGRETKHDFLVRNLNFNSAFYDTDNYFEKNVGKQDLVCFIGGQNLYYIDFPFVPWPNKANKECNYLATQYVDLPPTYGSLPLVYQNKTTKVKLYKL